MTEISLPKHFQQKDIDYLTGGKGNKEWEKYIGKPKMSYSDLYIMWGNQYTTNPLKDFVLQRFFKQPSAIHSSYGEFGSCVEKFLYKGVEECGLSEAEKDTLRKITPYGNFQQSFLIDFNGDFVLVGLIDDMAYSDNENEGMRVILRDYKTASESSKSQYETGYPAYKQLHVYALAYLMNHNVIPEKLEATVISRLGNPFKGEKLQVGSEIWEYTFTTNEAELLQLKVLIEDTVKLISDFYKVYLKLNV